MPFLSKELLDQAADLGRGHVEPHDGIAERLQGVDVLEGDGLRQAA
ncbi:MAG: hypothetical protein M0C28_45495 [Candidatus Moduliflexus flocculans]|nr:hypothetical protein [Candidatus Moduliflexus flocculans]